MFASNSNEIVLVYSITYNVYHLLYHINIIITIHQSLPFIKTITLITFFVIFLHFTITIIKINLLHVRICWLLQFSLSRACSLAWHVLPAGAAGIENEEPVRCTQCTARCCGCSGQRARCSWLRPHSSCCIVKKTYISVIHYWFLLAIYIFIFYLCIYNMVR